VDLREWKSSSDGTEGLAWLRNILLPDDFDSIGWNVGHDGSDAVAQVLLHGGSPVQCPDPDPSIAVFGTSSLNGVLEGFVDANRDPGSVKDIFGSEGEKRVPDEVEARHFSVQSIKVLIRV